MNLPLTLRLMLRELHGSLTRSIFFVACLSIGVAAIVAVGAQSAALDTGIRRQARELLAADLAISGRQAVPAELLERLEARPGWAVARVRELVTMIAAPSSRRGAGPSQLVELKAVAAGYPFYGKLVTEPRGLGSELGEEGALVAPDLLRRLGVEVGDEVLIGGEPFRILGKILSEPDRLSNAFTLGPRVFLGAEGLDRTRLDRFGSRVDHSALIRLPSDLERQQLGAVVREIRGQLDATRFRIRSYAQAQPTLRDGLRRLARYLGLVALLSLLLGGLGVAQTSRAWLAGRMDSIAVLRCLGVRPGEVVLLYLLQALVLGGLGSAVGAVLGTAGAWILPRLLGEPLQISLSPLQPAALARGVGMGLGVAVLATLPTLVAARRVPPLRVLRRSVEPVRPPFRVTAVTGLILVAGIWASGSIQADSPLLGAGFTAGIVLAGAFLALAAWLLIAALGRLSARVSRPSWRHGLAAMSRPGSGAVGGIVALGLGVLLILAMSLVQRGLSTALLAQVFADAPSVFLVGIGPERWPPLQELLRAEGAEQLRSLPVVSARLARVAGRDVQSLVEAEPENRGRRWALTREQRVTMMETLPEDNEIVAGSLWRAPGVDELSVEAEFATDLGVTVGDELQLDVQGVLLDFRITSLRRVDWGSFGLNFFLIAEPGTLADAPRTRVASGRLERGREQHLQDLLARDFPEVTLLRLREILERLATVIRRLALGVTVLGSLTVATGAAILAGVVSVGAARRGPEVALLKTLGMTRRQVIEAFAIEYSALGVVAGGIGCGGATLLSWTVLTHGMEVDWAPDLLVLSVGLAGTVLLTVTTAVLAGWPALRRPPLETLRTE